MGAGNRSSVLGFLGPQGVDMRQPLVSHMTEVAEGVLDADAASALVSALAAARNNPEEMRRLLTNAFGASDEALVSLVRKVMRLDQTGSEIAWLPLEAMINVAENGTVLGFKGPTELDNWFQRWKAWQEAAGRNVNEITPENFINDLRVDQYLITDNAGRAVGFSNPVAQDGYRRWVLAQARKAQGNPNLRLADLTDADFVAHRADVYMKHVVPGKRPATAIETMFGPTPVRRTGADAINRAPGPDNTDWGRRFGRDIPEPEVNWKQNIINLITNAHGPDGLQARARAAFEARFRDGVPDGAVANMPWDDRIPAWINDALLHHVEAAGAMRSDLGDNILLDQLLRESLDSDAGDEVLKKLLGAKNLAEGINSDEFVERLIDSYLVFGAIAVNMNIPWHHAAYGRLGGMFELIQKGMSRSGTMRGYAFELEVIFTTIKQHSHNADIVLQFKINNLDGPDLMLVTASKVKVNQMKAYKSTSALYHFNGEAARQTGSDIRRFMDEYMDDLDTLASGTGPLDWPSIPIDGHGPRQLDNTWTFFVDGRRTPGGMSARVQQNLADSATEMNGFLTNTAQATQGNVADILAKSTEKLVKGGTETIGDKLRLAMGNASPPLTVAQVALLRMLMQENMGNVSAGALDELVNRARVASRLNPPVQIAFDVRNMEHLNAASHASTFAGHHTVGN